MERYWTEARRWSRCPVALVPPSLSWRPGVKRLVNSDRWPEPRNRPPLKRRLRLKTRCTERAWHILLWMVRLRREHYGSHDLSPAAPAETYNPRCRYICPYWDNRRCCREIPVCPLRRAVFLKLTVIPVWTNIPASRIVR